MSNAEHAIENAISAIEKDIDFKTWSESDINLQYITARPEEVWDMAIYVVHTRCEYDCPYNHNK